MTFNDPTQALRLTLVLRRAIIRGDPIELLDRQA